MAKEIYPFAYIVQGDFVGQYVYYQDYDDKYFVRSESVYNNGFFSSGLWYHANYEYIFRDIIGYEEIGSATHSADAASVLKAGFWLGTVGAMAASAAGAGTTYDTAIYFKDGKQCVFRFLSSQVHQNHITSFHQLNIKPGDPAISGNNMTKIESAKPVPFENPTNPLDELETLHWDILEDARYDLYALPADWDDPRLVNYLRKYTNDIERVKQQLENWDVTVLLRADIPGTEVIRIMEEDINNTNISAMLGAKIRPQETKLSNTQNSTPTLNYEELKQLKELLDLGIITNEEFDTKKRQILGL